jgi:trigger factor
MQVTETLSEGLKRGFTVVVPAADIESRRTERLVNLGKTLRLPGFRPGKVPLPLVRQRYGTAVSAEVLDESVNEATRQVLSDRGLRPAMQPRIDLVEAGIGDAGRDLEFKMEVEVLPEIVMPDIEGIELTRLRAEVAPDAVDRALEEIARRNRDLVPVEEDRGAERGEVLTVDYVGRVDGAEFPGGTAKDMNLEVAGGGFIPGFTEQIEGMKPGESRVIEVTFPGEYGAKELAGKPASFEITAKALQRPVLPPIDDELGKKIGFGDLSEVREAITKQIQREYDQLSRLRIKRQLLDALAERATFPAPQGMVDAEFEQIWKRVEADRKEGRLDDEDRDKEEETLKSDYRGIAERRVRLGLLLAEIGRQNNVTVSPDEMTRAMRAEAMRYPGQEAKVMEFFRKNPQAAENLRGPLFEDKVVDFVLGRVKVIEQTVTPEELAQDPGEAAAKVEGGTENAESGAAEDAQGGAAAAVEPA